MLSCNDRTQRRTVLAAPHLRKTYFLRLRWNPFNDCEPITRYMTFSSRNDASWLRMHWFYPAAGTVLLAAFAAIMLDDWMSPRLLEASLLFDFAIFIPLLYLWCYRSRGKQAILQAIAQSCLGIWVVGYVVPVQFHRVLSKVEFVRKLGFAILIVIELKLVFTIFRTAFGTESSTKESAIDIATDSGMPPWAARLMAWEASLWRKAWESVKKITSRSQ